MDGRPNRNHGGESGRPHQNHKTIVAGRTETTLHAAGHTNAAGVRGRSPNNPGQLGASQLEARCPGFVGPCSACWAAAVKPFVSSAATCRNMATPHHTGHPPSATSGAGPSGCCPDAKTRGAKGAPKRGKALFVSVFPADVERWALAELNPRGAGR